MALYKLMHKDSEGNLHPALQDGLHVLTKEEWLESTIDWRTKCEQQSNLTLTWEKLS